jgi:flagellar protein FlbT
MALVITLKPHEKLFIGGAVLENGSTKAEFTILNDAPILREREILREQEAHTPAKRIYLAVQMMYMDDSHQPDYVKILNQLILEFAQAAPSTVTLLENIVSQVQSRQFYKALKEARRLITYEEDLLKHGQVAD